MKSYKPIENPGPSEARMLAQHPDWVEKHPHRLLQMRDEDRRLAKMRSMPPTSGKRPQD